MYGYIYKCTYTKTGKIYIGQKTGSKIDPSYYGSGSLWKKEVLVNCNPEDIHREILEICFSSDELNEKEKFWIDFYDSTNPEIGYNILLGGGPFNDEYRKNMSKTISYVMENKGIREKISKSLREYRKDHSFSQDHRQKLSKKAIGNSNFKQKHENKVVGFDTVNNPIEREVYTTCQTRCKPVWCELASGEKYCFNSIKEAGIWWHNKFAPFRYYSTCVYQRKIQNSINGEEVFYFDKEAHKKYKIKGIKWHYV